MRILPIGHYYQLEGNAQARIGESDTEICIWPEREVEPLDAVRRLAADASLAKGRLERIVTEGSSS